MNIYKHIQQLGATTFLLLSLCFLLIGSSYFILGYKRVDMNLFFYCYRNPYLNMLFLNATKLAEASVTIFILLVLFYYRNVYAITYLLIILVVTILVFILKHHVFGYVRPVVYLQDHLEIRGVNNLPLLQNFSFPSGHTTFVFAGMCYLSILVKKNWMQVIFFVLAILCAFSRVYLCQHFYIDIYVGALLGTMITCLMMFFLKEKWMQSTHPILSFSLKKYVESL